MPQEKDIIYTIEDIYNLPEGTRAELIDGKIYYMAPPNTTHQIISGELFTEINNYIRNKKGTCRVFSAPFAVYLNKDVKKYFEPDISVVCDPSKLDEDGCKGAPDWIIEITSPGNPNHDYIKKLNLYKAAGVREYWIVDPRNESVTVCYFEKYTEDISYSFEDIIKVNIYEDLFIDFNELNI